MSEYRDNGDSRPLRIVSLCPEAEYRASLSDDEFWAHVFSPDPPPEQDWGPSLLDIEDITAMSHIDQPCPECGQVGACSYDTYGRALIHLTPEDDE